MAGKIIFTGRVLANDYVSLMDWILSIHPGLIGWTSNNQDIKIVFNGNEYFVFKGENAFHIDDNTGFVIVATTDGKNLVAGKTAIYQIPGDQKIYFQNNFNDATNRVVVNSIREESMVLDKPFEIRRFFHNNRQLDYSMMSTFLKDYDNAYGGKRAPAPDLDWRDLSWINGDLKFEVLECEDASFIGEYKIDKNGGNGHQAYWFAGGEPNVATKHALFKLKKKQQDGTYASTDYEVGCTASDGAGEGWWQEAITPATRKDHWVIRINGGASGVVSSCKFTRVVNPTNQVKFTKDNYVVELLPPITTLFPVSGSDWASGWNRVFVATSNGISGFDNVLNAGHMANFGGNTIKTKLVASSASGKKYLGIALNRYVGTVESGKIIKVRLLSSRASGSSAWNKNPSTSDGGWYETWMYVRNVSGILSFYFTIHNAQRLDNGGDRVTRWGNAVEYGREQMDTWHTWESMSKVNSDSTNDSNAIALYQHLVASGSRAFIPCIGVAGESGRYGISLNMMYYMSGVAETFQYTILEAYEKDGTEIF